MVFRRIIKILCCIGLAASPIVAQAKPGQIALTFDDLPGRVLVNNQAYVTWLNAAILHSLRAHHMKATGFVNEGKLDEIDRARQIDVLRAWLNAGMDLGNHTFSHSSPNKVGAAAYIRDIARGEPVTRALLKQHGRTLRWFRHPYLETGTPLAVKQEIDGWLAAHHYRIAPVTIDANDWLFAYPYDAALSRHDDAHRRYLRAAYLAHTEKTLVWCQSVSTVLFGRQIPFVLLLHATRLNADSLDDLAAMLKRHDMRVVTLDKALKDPAYRTADSYSGPDGIDWLERWSGTLHKEMPWDSLPEAPADITAEDNKLEVD